MQDQTQHSPALASFLHCRVDMDVWNAVRQELSSLRLEQQNPGFHTLDLDRVLQSLPTLKQWFQRTRTRPFRVCYLISKAQSVQDIHIDRGISALALNLPLANCAHAHTRQFVNKGRVVVRYSPVTNAPYDQYVDDNPVESARYVLDAPMLINIKVPHSVVNSQDSNRHCLSFRFAPDPWHLVQHA